MGWQPGQSGNPAGNSKAHHFRAALDRAIAQDNGKRVRAAADKLLDKAAEGEAWAIKELADRLDGKPTQIVAGDPDNPLTIFGSIERRIVKAGA